jgi:hypothetical protein
VGVRDRPEPGGGGVANTIKESGKAALFSFPR